MATTTEGLGGGEVPRQGRDRTTAAQAPARDMLRSWVHRATKGKHSVDGPALVKKCLAEMPRLFFERLGRETMPEILYGIIRFELKPSRLTRRLNAALATIGEKGNGKKELRFKSIFNRMYEEVAPGRKVAIPDLHGADAEAAIQIRRQRGDRELRYADWLEALYRPIKGTNSTFADRWSSTEMAALYKKHVGGEMA